MDGSDEGSEDGSDGGSHDDSDDGSDVNLSSKMMVQFGWFSLDGSWGGSGFWTSVVMELVCAMMSGHWRLMVVMD